MILQLDPTIPVFAIGKGTGEAIAFIDYSQEHSLLWVVALDSNGEVWICSNENIRLLNNYSIGRVYETGKQQYSKYNEITKRKTKNNKRSKRKARPLGF